jgi:hypothetical protein
MFNDGTFGFMEFEVEGNDEPEDRDTNPGTSVAVSLIPLILAGTVIAAGKMYHKKLLKHLP